MKELKAVEASKAGQKSHLEEILKVKKERIYLPVWRIKELLNK